MQIVYCDKCGRRISEADLQNKLAFSVAENRFVCTQCSPMPAPTQALSKTTKSRITPARTDRISRTPSSRLKAAPGGSAPDKGPPLIALGIGALAVLLLAVWALSGGKTEPLKKTANTPAAPPSPPPVLKMPTPPPPPPPPPPPVPVPVPTPVPNPAVPAKTVDTETKSVEEKTTEMPDLRSEIAAKMLANAKTFAKEHPDDPWRYQELLQGLASYRSTPAGAEAEKLLADLKVPPRPEMQGKGDWETLFDGKGADPYKLASTRGWKMSGGALQREPNVDNSVQMKKEITDGEFRIRFEWSGDEQVYFGFRQSSEGTMRVNIDRRDATKDGKTYELIVLVDGERCKATLNGKNLDRIIQTGTPKTGRIQFNAKSDTFRLLSIEQRKLAPKP